MSRWIAYARPHLQCPLRLFCFHFAGGAASLYRPWVSRLFPSIDVLPVQLPGRETRFGEPPLRFAEEVASALLSELQPLLVEKPVALFGHSMGALLAFEVARRLPTPPVVLFLSGCPGPTAGRHRPSVHDKDDRAILDRLRAIGGVPADILADTRTMNVFLPTLRADFSIVENYAPPTEARLASPIVCFAGAEDPEASTDEVRSWSRHTDAEFLVHTVPGDHFFIRSASDLVLAVVERELMGRMSRS